MFRQKEGLSRAVLRCVVCVVVCPTAAGGCVVFCVVLQIFERQIIARSPAEQLQRHARLQPTSANVSIEYRVDWFDNIGQPGVTRR